MFDLSDLDYKLHVVLYRFRVPLVEPAWLWILRYEVEKGLRAVLGGVPLVWKFVIFSIAYFVFCSVYFLNCVKCISLHPTPSKKVPLTYLIYCDGLRQNQIKDETSWKM